MLQSNSWRLRFPLLLHFLLWCCCLNTVVDANSGTIKHGLLIALDDTSSAVPTTKQENESELNFNNSCVSYIENSTKDGLPLSSEGRSSTITTHKNEPQRILKSFFSKRLILEENTLAQPQNTATGLVINLKPAIYAPSMAPSSKGGNYVHVLKTPLPRTMEKQTKSSTLTNSNTPTTAAVPIRAKPIKGMPSPGISTATLLPTRKPTKAKLSNVLRTTTPILATKAPKRVATVALPLKYIIPAPIIALPSAPSLLVPISISISTNAMISPTMIPTNTTFVHLPVRKPTKIKSSVALPMKNSIARTRVVLPRSPMSPSVVKPIKGAAVIPSTSNANFSDPNSIPVKRKRQTVTKKQIEK